MLQIIGDAFIQFDPYVIADWIKKIKIIIPPIFIILYIRTQDDKNKFRCTDTQNFHVWIPMVRSSQEPTEFRVDGLPERRARR